MLWLECLQMNQQGRNMRQAMTALKEQTLVMKAAAQEAFAQASAERENAEQALTQANADLAKERGSVSDLQVGHTRLIHVLAASDATGTFDTHHTHIYK